MNYIACIPARGGSKGIPKKNIYPLAGKPLISYSIGQALKAKHITRVLVSTDCDEIAEVARSFGAEVIKRPPELAQDETPTIDALLHLLKQLETEETEEFCIVLLQPTSPLRRDGFIDECIKQFRLHEADGLITVKQVSAKIGSIEGGLFKPAYKEGSRRQDMQPLYADAGSLYISKPEILHKGSIWGEKIQPIEVDAIEGLDIDTPEDIELARFYLQRTLPA